jgi:transposase
LADARHLPHGRSRAGDRHLNFYDTRNNLRRGVPTGLQEIAQLGRTPSRRRADILCFFDHHASNGRTEAINGRLEALRRNALGFRNLTNYRWRSLLHSGALHQLVNVL